ncbi:MAG: LicD family protein [bacterium]
MDEQLKFIIEQFEKHEINYWVDSGTLLGLVRDGKLIEGDNDIDVGVWESEVEKIQQIKSVFLENSFSIKEFLYKKKLFKINLKNRFNKNFRKIDINIFRKINSHSFCYQPVLFESDSKLVKIFVNFASRLVTQLVLNIGKKFNYEKFPFNITRSIYYWWVPVLYFEKTEFLEIEGLKIKTPFSKEKYLEERYGDWKVPNPKWNFVRDDGLLCQEIPVGVEEG